MSTKNGIDDTKRYEVQDNPNILNNMILVGLVFIGLIIKSCYIFNLGLFNSYIFIIRVIFYYISLP